MMSQDFWAAVEAEPSAMTPQDRESLGQMLGTTAFRRAARGMFEKIEALSTELLRLDLENPDARNKAKKIQLQVQSYYEIFELLLAQSSPEPEDAPAQTEEKPDA